MPHPDRPDIHILCLCIKVDLPPVFSADIMFNDRDLILCQDLKRHGNIIATNSKPHPQMPDNSTPAEHLRLIMTDRRIILQKRVDQIRCRCVPEFSARLRRVDTAVAHKMVHRSRSGLSVIQTYRHTRTQERCQKKRLTRHAKFTGQQKNPFQPLWD